MRHESCLTSFPWMPSEAVTGSARAVFGTGPAHYDNPAPGEPGALEGLRQRTGLPAGQLPGALDGVVCRSSSVTVAAGPTWRVPAGVNPRRR